MPRYSVGLRLLRLAGITLLLAIVCVSANGLEESAIATLAMPSVLYLGVTVAAVESFFISRLLASAAVTSIAPASHFALAGEFSASVVVAWAALASLLVTVHHLHCRLRRSAAHARRVKRNRPEAETHLRADGGSSILLHAKPHGVRST